MPPLHSAALRGDAKATRTLLDHGHHVDALDKAFGTPLRVAVAHGVEPVARLLISRGANVNHTTGEGESVLYAAVQTLADSGPDHRRRLMIGSPAHRAAPLALIRLLLDNGARPDLATAVGLTPLHLATVLGDVSVMRLLLDRGADASASSAEGSTPLHLALAAESSLEVMRELVKGGADVNAANLDGHSPMLVAILLGSEDIFRVFLPAGPDFGATDHEGNTFIHAAVKGGDDSILSRLLQESTKLEATHGEANPLRVNAVNKIRETPLHIAAARGRTAMAKTLVGHGADVDARDAALSTPLVEAILRGHDEVAAFLISWGAAPAIAREFRFLQKSGDKGRPIMVHVGADGPTDVAALRKSLGGDGWEEYVDEDGIGLVDGFLGRLNLGNI